MKMEIDEEGLPIKEDAELKVRSRLFLEGNYFVEVRPGTPNADNLEDGGTIPPNQTASPVQFGQLLTALQSETREDLRTFLREYSSSLKGAGARPASTRRSSTGRTPTRTRPRSTTPRAAPSATT